jgi:hypothetical protein
MSHTQEVAAAGSANRILKCGFNHANQGVNAGLGEMRDALPFWCAVGRKI